MTLSKKVWGIRKPAADSDSQELSFRNENGKITSLSVGQMMIFDGEDGVITQKLEGSTKIITAKDSSRRLTLQLRLFESQRGLVLFAETSGNLKKLATVDCLSLSDLESSNDSSPNVFRVGFAETKRMDQKVFKRIESVDIAFEMGDGYYDQKSWNLFRVMNPKKGTELLGYLVKADFSFTEGDDVEVSIYFDRNGLRVTKDLRD